MDRSWKHIKNNNVLLVKIEGPGAGIPSIIIETCCERGKQTPLLINQPMGKGHLWSKNLSKMVIMLNIHLVECTRYLFQGHWLKKHHRPFTNHSPTSCRQLWLPATVRKRRKPWTVGTATHPQMNIQYVYIYGMFILTSCNKQITVVPKFQSLDVWLSVGFNQIFNLFLEGGNWFF